MNTHRAYAIHETYDPPRHKLIASGDADYCTQRAAAHEEKHNMPTLVEAAPLTTSGTPRHGDHRIGEWPNLS